MGIAESGSFFAEFSRNKVFIPSLFAWAVAQVFKVLLGAARDRRFNFKWFLRSGGMPSSHTALSMCLSTSTGLYYGFDSGLFALALGFAAITMFDAQGVRRHSGKQAEALNRLLEDIYSNRGFQEARVKELLGHTPVEVFAGCALGIATAFLFYKG